MTNYYPWSPIPIIPSFLLVAINGQSAAVAQNSVSVQSAAAQWLMQREIIKNPARRFVNSTHRHPASTGHRLGQFLGVVIFCLAVMATRHSQRPTTWSCAQPEKAHGNCFRRSRAPQGHGCFAWRSRQSFHSRRSAFEGHGASFGFPFLIDCIIFWAKRVLDMLWTNNKKTCKQSLTFLFNNINNSWHKDYKLSPVRI